MTTNRSTAGRFAARAAYICRGCGTSISTPSSFRKCPMCGIKFN